ncbi:two-component system, LuxR family, sensor kinase FixL [Bradyrhizobium shewense]|uniref:Sensor protein FixL n=1 Tax=Bradyrhizobium shewense TaxID=1761772 RepID=A0A1C3XQC0_9BRAD|nr:MULTISPECIES: sensor protein FixL [Bradyrhizobium]PPQ18515.1 PAS domain S-box protein [Bradyrhizobium sp. AC87j1]SCB54204.1 two-component system, LuxR family, sensor kinase FixL [Bradyrhizobium shewense]
MSPTRVTHPPDDGRGEHFRVRIEGFGVGTWDLDLSTQELEWSETARTLLGIERGQPASYDLFLSRLEPEDRARVETAIKQVAEHGGGFDVSFRISGKADRGKWIRARAGLIRDEVGVARHLSGIFLDIDEEKQVEEALRTRETHLRSILHTIPDAMIVIDGHGIMQLFSTAAERLFGWSEHEAIGQNVSILMPEPDRTRHDGYIARYRSTNDPHIIGIGRIVTGKRRDGTTFPMHLSIGEMESAGEPYFTGFVRDLTEHQQTQARLQELQSELVHVSRLTAMGEMASALAHELNQPLAAISNYMKGSRRLLAGSTDANTPKIESALDRAAEQALRAGQIIRRLRDFVSRGESEKRVESLSKLIEEAGALGLAGAREQNVQLRFSLDPDSDLVLADRVQIQQVLVNLFRNALEAMAQSPRRELVVANTRVADDMIEVEVSDTGSGFQGDVIPNLFQTFFTTKETGMGVGLSISRSIIEAHGGRMWAESNASGGATFRFTLPATAEN